MSDALPPPSPPTPSTPGPAAAAAASGYPVRFDIQAPPEVARWRWFVHWLLVVPHLFVLAFVMFAAMFAVVGAWFAALFTRRTPDGLARFIVGTLRYQARVNAFAWVLTEDYPPFRVPSSLADPGDHPAVTLDVEPVGQHSRALVLFRYVAMIPHGFVLYFLGLFAGLAGFLSFVAALFTGAWPQGMRRFVIGTLRWQVRVGAWLSLAAAPYPPFSLD